MARLGASFRYAGYTWNKPMNTLITCWALIGNWNHKTQIGPSLAWPPEDGTVGTAIPAGSSENNWPSMLTYFFINNKTIGVPVHVF